MSVQTSSDLAPITREGPGPMPIPHRAALPPSRFRETQQALVRWVNRNPAQALAIAAVSGIVVGRLARLLVDRLRDR